MRRTFAVLLVFACSTYATDEIPIPSAEAVSRWVHFNRPVALARRTDVAGEAIKWGNNVWTAQYGAPEETLTAIMLSVYARGSFLSGGRLDKLREMAQNGPRLPNGQRLVTIERLAGDRELLTFPGGFGPGGSVVLAFVPSRDKRYDLVVGVAADSEHGSSAEHRLENPAELQSSIRDILKAFDNHVSNPQ